MTSPAAPLASADSGPEAGEQVQLLLDSHGLSDAACAVAYFSFADPGSCVAAYDPRGPLTPLIGFLPLPMNGAELCEAIEAIDENGPRLLANFRRAFPADAGQLGGFDAEVGNAETAAPGWLFAACSLALGLEQRDVLAAMSATIEPVGLDTFVIEAGEGYLLDGRRLLRSLMSYRIGGVAKHVLARSVFESLGAFAAGAILRLRREWRADAVVLAGDLFEHNAMLRERALRGLRRSALPVACAGRAETMRPVPPSALGAGRSGRGPVPLKLITKGAAWPGSGQPRTAGGPERS